MSVAAVHTILDLPVEQHAAEVSGATLLVIPEIQTAVEIQVVEV